ncbi:MAG: DUF3299 domain-containing protein [Rhodospirillales bacterium]|nr:DUF3299 domain-containing protein [Rhodospirillales bacterium]
MILRLFRLVVALIAFIVAPHAMGSETPYRELTWKDLIPPYWNPNRILETLDFNALSDNDPRANEAMAKVRAEWDQAPVVTSLAGQKVRLPGFVVMLEGDEKSVSEFLLVPYFGACIHVPPPPANQLVHVRARTPVPDKVAMFTVWVYGTLATEHSATSLGHAGYRMVADKVEPYVVDKAPVKKAK